jgi:eukaryotic-like serine/threonine-protein kinase
MSPERYQQVKALFQAAMEVTPERRIGFLSAACKGDEELRQEVESLIHAFDDAGDFIEKPAVEPLPPTLPDNQRSPLSGKRIGPYKIVQEIGHGGMGAVYLAVRADDEVRKRAAIKLVRRGMDTESILRRFRHERQILASLDHPNIARFLDGGTTEDGLPWLALEYVEGMPIDEYCDRHQLSTVERLQIFRTVCSAVQHAHQNLVVHRDLKPSNILITADGTPKLLDFGIAKILNPELSSYTIDPTVAGMQLMTPGYASPEQVRGETITTATDVYSLGVVLYELLTGHRPYHVSTLSPQEVERVVCEQEPAKPSTIVARTEIITRDSPHAATTITPENVSKKRNEQPEKLRRKLVGDLDNIVLMALRKDAQRRYASVEQLSEDIRRHLEGLPVVARTDTFVYRTQKFVQRNKTAAIAAVLLSLTLLGGIIATSWQAYIARTERAKAQQRFDDIRGLATSFLFELDKDIESLPGSIRAREKLVSKALETFDKLARQASGDRSLQLELATAYATVSNIQWSRYYAHLGNFEGAKQSARKAMEIREQLVAADPRDENARRDLAYSYISMGDLMTGAQQLNEALEFYRKSVKLREELIAAHPNNVNDRLALMISYQRVGDTAGNPNFANLGDTASALAHYEKMLSIDEDLAEEFPKNPDYQHNLRIAYEKIRDVRWGTGDREGAFEVYRKALTINEKLVADYPQNTRYQRDLNVAHRKTCLMLAETGQLDEADEHCQQAQRICEAIRKADPANASALADLIGMAFTWYSAAMLAQQNNQPALAREFAVRGLALLKTQAEKRDASAQTLSDYAYALSIFEPAELRNGAAALLYARRAAALKNDDPFILDALAWAFYASGDYAQAISTVEQALAKLPAGAGARTVFEADLSAFQAAAKWQAGQQTEAIALLEKSLAALDQGANRRPLLERVLAQYKSPSKAP